MDGVCGSRHGTALRAFIGRVILSHRARSTTEQGRKRLTLLMKPRRCGLLSLIGLRWRLFGEVRA